MLQPCSRRSLPQGCAERCEEKNGNFAMQAATRIASLGDAAWDEPQLPAAQARSATARHPCFVCVLRRQRRRPSRQRSFAQPNPALSSATEAPVRRVRPLPPFLSPVFWVVSVQVGLKRDEMLLLRTSTPSGVLYPAICRRTRPRRAQIEQRKLSCVSKMLGSE